MRPWLEFTVNPTDWSYSKRRLSTEPKSSDGYAGFAQELAVAGRGTVLFAVFVRAGDIVLLLGSEARSLFSPGLTIEHRRGTFSSHLRITTQAGESSNYRYKRRDSLLAFMDSTYNDLDFELAHLPATLPSLAKRNRKELVAEWSTQAAAQPGAPADAPRPADSGRG